LQVRFVLRYLNKEKKLPVRELMLQDESKEKDIRFKIRGFTKRQFHMMGPLQAEYYNDLADTAGIERIPPVFSKLHNESSNRFQDDLVHYRDDRYKIIDNENYVQLND
jgi:dimethylaniline monooxygenase (N-oxide forming)